MSCQPRFRADKGAPRRVRVYPDDKILVGESDCGGVLYTTKPRHPVLVIRRTGRKKEGSAEKNERRRNKDKYPSHFCLFVFSPSFVSALLTDLWVDLRG